MVSNKAVKSEAPKPDSTKPLTAKNLKPFDTNNLQNARSENSSLSSLPGTPTLMSSSPRQQPLDLSVDGLTFTDLLDSKKPAEILDLLDTKLVETTARISEIEMKSNEFDHRYGQNRRRESYTTLEVQADREKSTKLKQRWVELNCGIEILEIMLVKVIAEARVQWPPRRRT
ncbi:hypothetical protein K490DRAFT_64412 [Saccharata proteae CBS 121410]|uniref:Uncharacterized protein n=1 Tax=Saccharata proteae CBS 121410 TaxID=1314787 RepID=A0A6A5YBF6_9PEZI|nr:hypothetical protein K490DRAFT_64412 [Saccharata proteae CBS 121410]